MEAYEMIDTIGEGTYGVVFRARHRETGQLVAIKKFKESDEDEQVRKTALREVRILKQLRHDNIVTLLEVFRRKRKLYLVFEYMDRTLLDDIEARPDGLDPVDVKKFMWQMVRSVEYCHNHAVIHRDIKPENLLVSRNGVMKLCDFGFARTLTGPGARYTDYVSTRWYRCPELLIGDVAYGKPVDMWSVGCVMAEVCTGLPLFPGDSDVDQLFRIMRVLGNLNPRMTDMVRRHPLFAGVELPRVDTPDTLETVLAGVDPLACDVIKRCLRYEPLQRMTATELLRHPFFAGMEEWFTPLFQACIDRDAAHNVLAKRMVASMVGGGGKVSMGMTPARGGGDVEPPTSSRAAGGANPAVVAGGTERKGGLGGHGHGPSAPTSGGTRDGTGHKQDDEEVDDDERHTGRHEVAGVGSSGGRGVGRDGAGARMSALQGVGSAGVGDRDDRGGGEGKHDAPLRMEWGDVEDGLPSPSPPSGRRVLGGDGGLSPTSPTPWHAPRGTLAIPATSTGSTMDGGAEMNAVGGGASPWTPPPTMRPMHAGEDEGEYGSASPSSAMSPMRRGRAGVVASPAPTPTTATPTSHTGQGMSSGGRGGHASLRSAMRSPPSAHISHHTAGARWPPGSDERRSGGSGGYGAGGGGPTSPISFILSPTAAAGVDVASSFAGLGAAHLSTSNEGKLDAPAPSLPGGTPALSNTSGSPPPGHTPDNWKPSPTGHVVARVGRIGSPVLRGRSGNHSGTNHAVASRIIDAIAAVGAIPYLAGVGGHAGGMGTVGGLVVPDGTVVARRDGPGQLSGKRGSGGTGRERMGHVGSRASISGGPMDGILITPGAGDGGMDGPAAMAGSRTLAAASTSRRRDHSEDPTTLQRHRRDGLHADAEALLDTLDGMDGADSRTSREGDGDTGSHVDGASTVSGGAHVLTLLESRPMRKLDRPMNSGNYKYGAGATVRQAVAATLSTVSAVMHAAAVPGVSGAGVVEGNSLPPMPAALRNTTGGNKSGGGSGVAALHVTTSPMAVTRLIATAATAAPSDVAPGQTHETPMTTHMGKDADVHSPVVRRVKTVGSGVRAVSPLLPAVHPTGSLLVPAATSPVHGKSGDDEHQGETLSVSPRPPAPTSDKGGKRRASIGGYSATHGDTQDDDHPAAKGGGIDNPSDNGLPVMASLSLSSSGRDGSTTGAATARSLDSHASSTGGGMATPQRPVVRLRPGGRDREHSLSRIARDIDLLIAASAPPKHAGQVHHASGSGDAHNSGNVAGRPTPAAVMHDAGGAHVNLHAMPAPTTNPIPLPSSTLRRASNSMHGYVPIPPFMHATRTGAKGAPADTPGPSPPQPHPTPLRRTDGSSDGSDAVGSPPTFPSYDVSPRKSLHATLAGVAVMPVATTLTAGANPSLTAMASSTTGLIGRGGGGLSEAAVPHVTPPTHHNLTLSLPVRMHLAPAGNPPQPGKDGTPAMNTVASIAASPGGMRHHSVGGLREGDESDTLYHDGSGGGAAPGGASPVLDGPIPSTRTGMTAMTVNKHTKQVAVVPGGGRGVARQPHNNSGTKVGALVTGDGQVHSIHPLSPAHAPSVRAGGALNVLGVGTGGRRASRQPSHPIPPRAGGGSDDGDQVGDDAASGEAGVSVPADAVSVAGDGGYDTQPWMLGIGSMYGTGGGGGISMATAATRNTMHNHPAASMRERGGGLHASSTGPGRRDGPADGTGDRDDGPQPPGGTPFMAVDLVVSSTGGGAEYDALRAEVMSRGSGTNMVRRGGGGGGGGGSSLSGVVTTTVGGATAWDRRALMSRENRERDRTALHSRGAGVMHMLGPAMPAASTLRQPSTLPTTAAPWGGGALGEVQSQVPYLAFATGLLVAPSPAPATTASVSVAYHGLPVPAPSAVGGTPPPPRSGYGGGGAGAYQGFKPSPSSTGTAATTSPALATTCLPPSAIGTPGSLALTVTTLRRERERNERAAAAAVEAATAASLPLTTTMAMPTSLGLAGVLAGLTATGMGTGGGSGGKTAHSSYARGVGTSSGVMSGSGGGGMQLGAGTRDRVAQFTSHLTAASQLFGPGSMVGGIAPGRATAMAGGGSITPGGGGAAARFGSHHAGGASTPHMAMPSMSGLSLRGMVAPSAERGGHGYVGHGRY